MNQELNQAPLSPDETASALSFATHIQEGIHTVVNPPEAQQQPQDALGEERTPETGKSQPDPGKELESRFSQLEKKLTDGLGSIKDEIKKALNDEEGETP